MPTLVTELTPLQRMWLYENQLTRGDSYEERWHTMRSPSFDTTIFRARNFEPTPPSAARKRKHENVPHSKGPRFHYYGDKLTWQQSYENLKVYRDHYGNCNVPQKYKENPKLGRWVNKQRKKKKNPAKYGALQKSQVEKLEELGFAWMQ